MEDSFDEEITAWPSYVDFLLSFCFVLVLALGYMVFISVHGVEGEDFARDATSGEAALKQMGLDPRVDWNEHRVYVPLRFVVFDVGCPMKKTGCPQDLPADQQDELRKVAQTLSTRFQASRTILLRGQADRTKGSDDFTNFRVASERAVAVYKVLLLCAEACGLNKVNGSLSKVQLDNVGDTQASGTGKEDRTVTLILDYTR